MCRVISLILADALCTVVVVIVVRLLLLRGRQVADDIPQRTSALLQATIDLIQRI
jgi:hypothetical protein